MTAALVVTTGFGVAQTIENRRLITTNTELDARINNDKTGYVVRLRQAEANAVVCTEAVRRQSAAVRDQSKRDTATIANVQARYDVEHVARLRAERSAAAFLARKPQGATVSEQVLDVDAQILGDLK